MPVISPKFNERFGKDVGNVEEYQTELPEKDTTATAKHEKVRNITYQ